MKRFASILQTICTCLFALSGTISASEWIDVTDIYIINPRFDNGDTDGWNISSGATNTKAGYGGMEFWNGWFNIGQCVNIPNGRYRISVQAYYRMADNEYTYPAHNNGYEEITAFLYANNDEKALASIFSDYVTTPECDGYVWATDDEISYRYYPNGMEFGAYCFEQGKYKNSIEVDVTDGILDFGIYCWDYYNSNWCMMDNFKIEYYGEITYVSSIILSHSSLTLINGERRALTATISPANATYPIIRWYSDNPKVADVDEYGTVTGYQRGRATIYAETTDGSGTIASCNVSVTSVTPTDQNIVINEIQSANIDMFIDPSFNYGGWVELYNPTNEPVSLNGLYVSDDAANLTKYNLGKNRGIIPAKGYHTLWFDHCNNQFPSQINFKLDYDGGGFYISDSKGELITSQDYPIAVPRTSYARRTDGGDEWGITSSPTPDGSNASSPFATERTAAPTVDTDACLFTTPFTVNVQIPSNTILRYTTDGTTPTPTNGNISKDGTFYVTNTSIYRFCLFEEGKLPSQVVTRSYIYRDRDYMLPVISVVTDPINLYDDSLGVYVRGVNGRTGNGQSTPCNWNMDWDRPVNFEYITPEEGMVVNQEVDFSMCGGWSRAWEPHSFKLKAAKIYEGLNSIDYPFFADKPHLKHKTLQIRNGGNDTNCRLKDAALQAIVHSSGLDVDGQSTQPVMHFINGEYKGMLNMREPNNKHYAYANWGIDTDEMDQFEMSPDSGYVQMEGDRAAFLEWYELSKNAANETIYEKIRNLVDIDEYINYMAVEFYLGGNDWPQNNIKGFRPRTEDGRFRFVLFDLDGTLATTSPFHAFEGKQNYTFDYIYDIGGRLTEEIEMVTIFLNMLLNDTFRKQFIDTYCLVTGSVFEPNRCNAFIDEMATNITPALALENRSPNSTANQLKNLLSGRQDLMINALVNYSRMELNNGMRQSVSITTNAEGAILRLNDMEIPTGKFNGTLFAPITLKAEPKAGYRFAGWSEAGGTATSTALIARGASWYYYDKGSLDDKNWKSTHFSTASWDQGKAPLGYFTSDTSNERGYNTMLNYGADANAKRPTYYFRNSFHLDKAPTNEEQFVLNYTIDDGMIVYINGIEAARYLMPNGTVSYNTYASSYANSNPDHGSLALDASLFKQGTNIIAIEVHNCDNKSSDIYFDAELMHIHTTTESTIVCKEAEYTLPTQRNLSLTALYEPLSEEEQEQRATHPVRINEVSADNSIYINEYYKKNDWIELFNTTPEAIDVAGMYLSDNPDNLTKYRITSSNEVNTIINPYSHLIIWADKLTTSSQLHASFKLAAEGGYVTLTAADQTWSDMLYYESHQGSESVGLYPDGSNDVYIMTKPTIAKANTINSYASWLEQPETPSSEISILFTDKDNLQLSYHERTVHLYNNRATWADITVYTATGRIIQRHTSQFSDGHASISLSTLSKGIYVISVADSSGDAKTMKICIK